MVYNLTSALYGNYDTAWNNLGRILRAIAKFIKGIWHEVGPFVRHGFAVGCLILVAAGVLWMLKFFLPGEHKDLEEADNFLIVALFWVFGICTLLVIANRLAHYLVEEFTSTWGPKGHKKKALPDEQAKGALNEPARGGDDDDQLRAEVREMRRELEELRRKEQG